MPTVSRADLHPTHGTSGRTDNTTTVRRTLIPRYHRVDPPIDQDVTVATFDDESAALILSLVDPCSSKEDLAKLPRFLPYVLAYAYVYRPDTAPPSSPLLEFHVKPLFDVSDDPRLPSYSRIALEYFHRVLWGTKHGYKKRMHMDQIIPRNLFHDNYVRLKDTYGAKWCKLWIEDTDPVKHVYEDISIAAYLISLWDLERLENSSSAPQLTTTRQKFVDVGCGNGLLVHILTEEGYSGYGIDLQQRKSWDLQASSDLRCEVINPLKSTFDVDWIIANHSDELTPFIPLIAHRSRCKFLSIPCCSWSLTGKFREQGKGGRYATYCRYLVDVYKRCGFGVEEDWLRIPSTKNFSIVCRTRTFDDTDQASRAAFEESIRGFEGLAIFVARKTDRVLGKEREERAERVRLLRKRDPDIIEVVQWNDDEDGEWAIDLFENLDEIKIGR